MAFDVKGILKEIFEEQQVSDRFRKREFVLEVNEGFYSEFIKFQLTQDKCSLVDGYQVGQSVKVSFNLKGRPYERDGRVTYFTNLEAWRIQAEAVAGEGTDGPPPITTQDDPGPDFSSDSGASPEDQLPF